MTQLLFLDIMTVLKYAALFIVLFIAEIVYLRIAVKLNISDVPNGRSSHKAVTVIGGGIIFWLSMVLASLYFAGPQKIFLIIGITLIAIVSFWDDVVRLKALTRMIVHFISTTFAFMALGIFNTLPLWGIILSYIMFVAIVNIFNFMDGINGITGLYNIAVLGSLQYVNLYVVSFISPELIWFPIIASFIFLFYNFRAKARCFAGDVGSISIGFWIATLLLALILKTGSLIWLGFLMVYGIDSILTILHRIYLGENITIAHRIHLCQIMVNEMGMSHRLVSLCYFLLQVLISTLLIAFYSNAGWQVFAITLILLVSLYFIKFKLMKEFGLRVKRGDSLLNKMLQPTFQDSKETIVQ